MDQIPPASFVNKMFRIQPCPFIIAALELHRQNWIVDTETLWPTKSKNIYYVNIYQNLQRWLADPWPRSSNVRAGGDVVQPAYITYEKSGGKRCCDLRYHILLRCVCLGHCFFSPPRWWNCFTFCLFHWHFFIHSIHWSWLHCYPALLNSAFLFPFMFPLKWNWLFENSSMLFCAAAKKSS